MKINVEEIKKLRLKTGTSIADCRIALDESNGDFQKALDWIKTRGLEKAEKKAERETSEGIIDYYIHQNGRVGVLIEVLCETDFVARTDEFKHLSHEVAMQIAVKNPKDVPSLLKQEYIRDSSKTIEIIIKEVIAKLGENIVVKRFTRFSLGE